MHLCALWRESFLSDRKTRGDRAGRHLGTFGGSCTLEADRGDPISRGLAHTFPPAGAPAP